MKASEFQIPTDWPLSPRDMTSQQLETIEEAHAIEAEKKDWSSMCDCGFCMHYLTRSRERRS